MSGLVMPKADSETLARRAEIVADLSAIVPGEGVVDAVNEMRAFESDGLTAYRQLPLVVVLPETVAQVSRVLKYCNERSIRVVPRGSGTSLSPSRASPISASPARSRRRASTTRPIRPRRSLVPSAATWRRIPAACTA
jgi:hypothetical protein